MLPFQIYVCAKTKEDQTATGIQKLKTLSTLFYTYGIFAWHTVYNFNICLLHALSVFLLPLPIH